MAEALICQYGSGQSSSLGDTRKDTFTETDFILKYSFSGQTSPSDNKVHIGWSSQSGGSLIQLFAGASNPSKTIPTNWSQSIAQIITNPLCDVERSVVNISAEYISHKNLSTSKSYTAFLFLGFIKDNGPATGLTYLDTITDPRTLRLGYMKDNVFNPGTLQSQHDMLPPELYVDIISMPLAEWRKINPDTLKFGLMSASKTENLYWSSKNGEISFKVNLKCDIIYKDFRG